MTAKAKRKTEPECQLKQLAMLHAHGFAIGVIEGTSLRDDVDADLRGALAAIADRLREQAQKLCESEVSH